MAKVNIGFVTTGPQAWRFAQKIEELGYESLWMPEGSTWEPGLCLTAAAAKTSRIKLGTWVTVVPYYHPWQLARRIVTLDHLSGGRYIFGAGSGWRPPEFEVAGAPYDGRGAYTNEALEIIRTILTEGNIHHEGRFFKIPELLGDFPRPVQKPHPPIVIGGGVSSIHKTRAEWPGSEMKNQDAALRRVAKYGDGYAPPPFNDLSTYQYSYDRILELASKEGRKLPERFMTIGLTPVNINPSPEKALEEMREEDAKAGRWWKGVYRSTGNPTEEDRKKYGALGPANRCIERISEIMKAPGLDRLVIGFAAPNPIEQLERFHQQVAPHLG